MLDGEEYLVLLSAYQEWLPGGSLQCGNGEESKGTKPNRGNSWRQDTQWNLPPEQRDCMPSRITVQAVHQKCRLI